MCNAITQHRVYGRVHATIGAGLLVPVILDAVPIADEERRRDQDGDKPQSDLDHLEYELELLPTGQPLA